MTAKKAIKITIGDNDQNKEKEVKKPAPKAKKPELKAAKPKKPRKPRVVAKTAPDNPVSPKKTKSKITVKNIKPKKVAGPAKDNSLMPAPVSVPDKPEADFIHEDEPASIFEISDMGSPLEKKLKERINVVSEDKQEELLLKGANAVRSVIDSSQKEKEDKEVEEIIEKKYSGGRSVRLYRKIAFSFVALTLVLLAVIFYFSFVKVDIILIPNQERVSNNMIFDVYDGDKHTNPEKNSIIGLVKKVKIKNSKDYEATSAEVIGKEAVGKVKIVNNYNKNQPLVASTRLLTSDGKLFRLGETVNIPAGGFIEASIYADEPSPEMAIPPTKFTIPGLWAGLQDKIYAESQGDVVYRQKVKKNISQEDIDNGIRDLKQQLLAGAKAEINDKYKEYDQIIYKIDENSITSETKGRVGEEKESFSILMEADVIVVAFNDQTAIELAKQKFISALAENKELLSFDEENIVYALNNYDNVEGLATVNATFEGKVTLKENSQIVDVNKILGLNKDQLNVYLENVPEIAGFEIKFYPSFITKVPRLVDRVNVEVKK